MNLQTKSSALTVCLSLLVSMYTMAKQEKAFIEINTQDQDEKLFDYSFSGGVKVGDTFYGAYTTFLNRNNCNDRLFKINSKADLELNYNCKEIFWGKVATRNKVGWGSNLIVPTTTSSTKILDSVGQRHKHASPRQLFWLREGWIEFSIAESLGMSPFEKQQTLTLGAFPFQLGRGIALGDAYAVSPDYIGFYSDYAVDQYALGAKLSGEIVKDKLSYDLYVALLDNQSDSLSRTEQNILGQQFGKLRRPERGFGKINRLFAGRLIWTVIDREDAGTGTIEPYFLVNTDPEQQVEFLGDATSKLGTFGIAGEFLTDRFEFGFETAFNRGHQCVKGWDRNIIMLQNRNGQVQEVNSHVLVNVDPIESASTVGSAYKAPHVTNGITAGGVVSSAGSNAKSLVNNAPQSEQYNGMSIGVATDLDTVSTIPAVVGSVQSNELFNATDRFRNKYCNLYRGWMMVADGAVFFKDRDVRLAGTAGYASGDLDPNSEQKDGHYKGFIGLQELYAGKRVKSAFFLGSAGKLQLPLDTPPSEKHPNRFGALTSGFTNIGFIGAGVRWIPQSWEKYFELNPNILAFWQTHPDRKFDLVTKTTTTQQSRSYLGTELNVHLKKQLLCDLYFFILSSIFIPGSHFDDVRGKPLNAKHQKILDRIDPTGFNEDSLPGLGKNISYTLNFGFEYKF